MHIYISVLYADVITYPWHNPEASWANLCEYKRPPVTEMNETAHGTH